MAFEGESQEHFDPEERELQQVEAVVVENSVESKDEEMANTDPVDLAESSSDESMPSSLDEDDLDLLEHTLGSRKGGSKGFRNLQRRIESDEEQVSGTSEGEQEEDEEEEGVLGRKRKGKVSTLDKLFDESDEEEQAKPKAKNIIEEDDEDDLDDFIEDDMAQDEEGYSSRPAVKPAAKKKLNYSRFGSGLSKDVLQDMMDIFGDGTEYDDMVDEQLATDLEELSLVKRKGKKKGVEDDRPMPPEQEVKVKDIPERYQAAGIVPLGEGELEKETIWISERLLPSVKERMEDISIERLIPVVGAVLSLIRDQLLEVPFIATHRKEYFQHLLGLTDLWRILDYDEEWRAFARQRDAFNTFMVTRGPRIVSSEESSVQDSNDLEFFQEYFKQVVRFGITPRTQGIVFADLLTPFVRSFTLEPGQFLMNWATKERRHEPGEIDDLSLGAVQYISEEMPSETAILRDARNLAALELAYHPTTNRMFRSALEAVASITVLPTPLGQREITMNHELAPFKYLAEKPIASFTDDLYLRLLKAEKAGLLTVSIVFRRLSDLESEWSDYYSGSHQDGPESCYEVRKAILSEALHIHLLPRVKRQIVSKLTKQAELYVAQGCQYALQSLLMQAPVNPGLSGMMAISWGDGSPSSVTMCVTIDANGRVVDQSRFLHLQDVSKSREEWDRLLSMIGEVKPAIVLIGGQSVRTIDLFDELKGRIRDLKLDVKLIFGNDDTGRIFQNSPRAQLEFPEYSPLLKYCVSLGRRWLHPLFELASLGPEEAYRLSLHPSQSLISTDMLSRFIQRAFINVVNLVGVDTGSIASNPWTRSPLKFVAGLGPNKAEALVQQMNKRLSGGRPSKRSDFADLLGPIVYTNCASFLRICSPVVPSSGRKKEEERQWSLEPLDDTRIHPENYQLARKIACDAMEMAMEADEGSNQEEADEFNRKAVIAVMKQPERLNDLLLDEYARELEKRLHTPKHLTLLDIKAELQAPYADLRSPVREASPETIFESLTGETESTLFIGQQVQAKVLRLTERAAICRLESGLTGLLPLSNLPPHPETGRPPSHPSKVLRPHQAIMAAVLDIHLTRFEVTLSMLPDDLREPRYPRSGDFDPYYDHELAKNLQKKRRGFSTAGDNQKETQSNSKPAIAPPTAPRRLISHPSYKDVSRLEAERLLSTAVLGEVIIRPSGSFGSDHLALTWKVDQCEQGGLYQHLDIEERERSADAYSLGKKLIISLPDGSKQTFEDLDEIIARFVEPISGFLKDVRSCPKFLPINSLDKTASRTAAEAHLAKERSKAPGRIAYCLSISRDKPGSVLLSYQPGARCHHEIVDVSPAGFKLRSTAFERLEALINWFKQNYNRR